MMGKVWVVTSGEYSDYSIDNFFASEALAQRFCDAENQSRNEYNQCEWNEREVEDTETPFSVTWTKRARTDGHTAAAKDGIETMSVEWGEEHHVVPPSAQVDISAYTHEVALTVTGSDLEAVRHVFNDRRARLKLELDEARLWTEAVYAAEVDEAEVRRAQATRCQVCWNLDRFCLCPKPGFKVVKVGGFIGRATTSMNDHVSREQRWLKGDK